MYYVYVLQNPENRLYIGFTSNLEQRLERHQSRQAGWTHTRGPWQLVYQESFYEIKDALYREKQLKSGRANQQLRNMLVQTNGRASPSDERKD